MRKAVLFDEFSYQCPYFNSKTDANNVYGCDHKEQKEVEKINGIEQGCCYCHCCPLGIEAEQEDLTEPDSPDAVQDEIDWDGLCEDGEVDEGEILLIRVGNDATEDEKTALFNYERHIHRYDKKWLDEHGIVNGLCE